MTNYYLPDTLSTAPWFFFFLMRSAWKLLVEDVGKHASCPFAASCLLDGRVMDSSLPRVLCWTMHHQHDALIVTYGDWCQGHDHTPSGWRQTQEQAERDGAIQKVKWMEEVVQWEMCGLQKCVGLCVRISSVTLLCPSYHYQLFTTVFKGSDQTANHIHSANGYLKLPIRYGIHKVWKSWNTVITGLQSWTLHRAPRQLSTELQFISLFVSFSLLVIPTLLRPVLT